MDNVLMLTQYAYCMREAVKNRLKGLGGRGAAKKWKKTELAN